MMRHRMVAVGNADLRIGPGAEFAGEHERDHAGDVGLKGNGPQIEQQSGVLFERIGNAGGGVGRAEFGGLAVLLLDPGDAALDFAQVFHVVAEAGLVFGIEAASPDR